MIPCSARAHALTNLTAPIVSWPRGLGLLAPFFLAWSSEEGSVIATKPYIVGVRVSPLERRTLEAIAEHESSSLSAVIRRAIVLHAQRIIQAVGSYETGDAEKEGKEGGMKLDH